MRVRRLDGDKNNDMRNESIIAFLRFGAGACCGIPVLGVPCAFLVVRWCVLTKRFNPGLIPSDNCERMHTVVASKVICEWK